MWRNVILWLWPLCQICSLTFRDAPQCHLLQPSGPDCCSLRTLSHTHTSSIHVTEVISTLKEMDGMTHHHRHARTLERGGGAWFADAVIYSRAPNLAGSCAHVSPHRKSRESVHYWTSEARRGRKYLVMAFIRPCSSHKKVQECKYQQTNVSILHLHQCLSCATVPSIVWDSYTGTWTSTRHKMELKTIDWHLSLPINKLNPLLYFELTVTKVHGNPTQNVAQSQHQTLILTGVDQMEYLHARQPFFWKQHLISQQKLLLRCQVYTNFEC